MKRCLVVLALLCFSLISYSQTCPGGLEVTIEGSSTDNPLDASGTKEDSQCNDLSGDLSGSIDVTVSGGSPDYTFDWEFNGSPYSETTEDLSGLGAGTYSVTITDSQNCFTELSFEITEPDPIVVTGVETDLDCSFDAEEDSTGAIDISVEGGTPDYTYSWTGPNGFASTSADLTDLDGGQYVVVVTDANNCTSSATFDLEEPELMTVSVDDSDLNCNSANGDPNGSFDITVAGGVSPYTYAWTTSTGGLGLDPSAEDQTELTAGTYTVVITDANFCEIEATYTLEEPDPMDVLAVATDPPCHPENGAPEGSIELTVSGGTAPYSYGWSNGESTSTITGLAAGTYTVVIQDANGCEYTANYNLAPADEILANGTEIQPTCNNLSGDLTGAINLVPTGGDGTLTYAWTGPNGFASTDQNISGLGAGTYSVVITDSKNCTETASFTLNEPDAVTCEVTPDVDGLCGTNIDCNGSTADVTVAAEGGTGAYEYSSNGVDFQSSNVFNLPAGTHTITTKDANGCTSTCEVTLTEPDALAGYTCVENDECQVGDGEIKVEAFGGCAPYTVTWNALGTGTLDQTQGTISSEGGDTTFTGADGGETYTFTITDANGCVIGG